MTFTVQVARIRHDFQLVEVEANDDAEARRKALKIAKENPEAWCDGSVKKHQTVVTKRQG